MSKCQVVPALSVVGAIAVLLLGAPSAGADRRITDGWPVLGSDRDGACRLSIASNGRIMQLRAVGFEPGEPVRLALTNAAMRPIDWTVRAGTGGAWSQLYIPFLWGGGDGSTRGANAGGTVAVTLFGSSCTLSASADWRREIRVIP